jgi:hypothetical protein
LVVAFFASLFFEFGGVREFVGLDFADRTLWYGSIAGFLVAGFM